MPPSGAERALFSSGRHSNQPCAGVPADGLWDRCMVALGVPACSLSQPCPQGRSGGCVGGYSRSPWGRPPFRLWSPPLPVPPQVLLAHSGPGPLPFPFLAGLSALHALPPWLAAGPGLAAAAAAFLWLRVRPRFACTPSTCCCRPVAMMGIWAAQPLWPTCGAYGPGERGAGPLAALGGGGPPWKPKLGNAEAHSVVPV